MREIVRPILIGLFCVLPLAAVQSATDDTTRAAASTSESTSQSTAEKAAVQQARAVMDAFLRGFNARNAEAVAATLLFPHVRIASGAVQVVPTAQAFVAATDMDRFARENNWDFSEWDSIELIQAGPNKVHFKVRFSRFNPQGERYVTFDSLYVVQKTDNRWGIRARSSFAP